MADFELSDEAKEKLGVNSDFSTPEKEEETDDKSEEKTTETSEKTEESKKDEETEDKSDDETTDESESEDEEPTFFDKVNEILKDFPEDPEERETLLKNLPNHKKFVAANIERATKQKEEKEDFERERETFNQTIKRLAHEDIQNSLDEILKLDDLEEFLESADEWYDGKDKNLFRKFINTMKDKYQGIAGYVKEWEDVENEKANLELEKEIIGVQALDPAYKESDNLTELAEIADKFGVNLATAHELKVSTQRADEAKTLNDKIKSQDEEITKLKKELKARNKEIKDLQSKNPPDELGPGAEGGGAKELGFKEKSSGFDETERRLFKKFGLERT